MILEIVFCDTCDAQAEATYGRIPDTWKIVEHSGHMCPACIKNAKLYEEFQAEKWRIKKRSEAAKKAAQTRKLKRHS